MHNIQMFSMFVLRFNFSDGNQQKIGTYRSSVLLTVTSPNQLCDVLLFVCSKMADETNLSSKLPVADRTRKV